MLYAPEYPTTQHLEAKYPLTHGQELRVLSSRMAASAAIWSPDNDLYIGGPCALTGDWDIIREENLQWDEFVAFYGIKNFLKRCNPYKPRTNTEDWHGLETESLTGGTPEESAENAYALIYNIATTGANVAMEMAFPYHVHRYGKLTSFAWVGSRHEEDIDGNTGLDFIQLLAEHEPTLPVGIKNKLNGDLDLALERVRKINYIRSKLNLGWVAPAVLIYRGGENVQCASAWYDEANRIINLPQVMGKTILDHAHMSEMACNPYGFIKSEEGQTICWDLAIELRKSGQRFVGSQTETSNLRGPVDPPIPLKVAMQKIIRMEQVKTAQKTRL